MQCLYVLIQLFFSYFTGFELYHVSIAKCYYLLECPRPSSAMSACQLLMDPSRFPLHTLHIITTSISFINVAGLQRPLSSCFDEGRGTHSSVYLSILMKGQDISDNLTVEIQHKMPQHTINTESCHLFMLSLNVCP